MRSHSLRNGPWGWNPDGQALPVASSEIGFKALHRKALGVDGMYTLREESEAYAGNFEGESDALIPDNTISWNKKAERTET